MDGQNDVSIPIFGFEIDELPPSPTGIRKYAPHPTKPVPLASATTAVVPWQTLDLSTPSPKSWANIKFNHGTFDSGQQGFKLDSMLVELARLDLTTSCAVTVTVVAKAVHHSSSLRLNNGGTYDIHMHEYRPYSWVLTPNELKPGSNALLLFSFGSGTVVVNAITVHSKDIQIEGTYWWDTLWNNTATPAEPGNHDIKVTSGIAETTTQTYSFAETIGVNVGGGLGDGLLKLNAALNASFSAGQSFSTSIALTESTTVDDSFENHPTKGAITQQYWQLVIQFKTSEGNILTQKLASDQVEFVPRSFIDPNYVETDPG